MSSVAAQAVQSEPRKVSVRTAMLEIPSKSGQAVGRRQQDRELAALLAAVLCVHLLAAYVARHGLVRDDAESYVVIGRSLARGLGYVFAPGRPPTAWRAPGYPVLLAFLFRLGGGLWLARLVNALLLTAAAALGYRLSCAMAPGLSPGSSARRRHAAALAAAGLIGFYPEFVGLTGLLWSENLFVPLFLAAVAALYAFSSRRTASAALAAGVLAGLCMLTRSTAVILIPLIWFCALRRGRDTGAVRAGLIATAAALVILGAWTTRNYVVTRHFVLVESNVGYNLYVGNRPDTPMPFAWRRAASLGHDALFRRLTDGVPEAESSAALTRVALQQIRRDPLRTFLLGFTKEFDFWLPEFFIARNLRAGALGAENVRLWKPFLAVSVVAYLILAAAAIAGWIAAARSWEARFLLLTVVLYALPHAIVYGSSRYHLPLIPLFAILAASAFRRRRAPAAPPAEPGPLKPRVASPIPER